MNDKIKTVLSHPAFIPTCVGLASFGAGFGVGIIFERKRKPVEDEVVYEVNTPDPNQFKLDFNEAEKVEKYRFIIDEEAYATVNDEDRVIDMGKDYISELVEEDGDNTDTEDPDIYEDSKNSVRKQVAFADEDDDDWDLESELATRTPDKPYIIHQDEYIAGGDEQYDSYSQTTLTYYALDDVLCDEHSVPIDRYEKVVGKLLFGHGSSDPSVVYVRNEKNKAEYEILKLDGHYRIEVLGLEIEHEYEEAELRHSKVHKFRDV